MTKRLIAGYCPGTGVLEPFDAIFDDVIDVTEGGMDKVDALILWGGTDISSQYYGEKPHRFHEHPHPPSQRDMLEYRAMKQAKIRGLPIIGVCRGAQFACVFAGGRLIQHVNNHSHNHNVRILETSEIMETSSCHHQMMFPYAMKDSDYEVLAISHKNRSSTHQDQYGKRFPVCSFTMSLKLCIFRKSMRLLSRAIPNGWILSPRLSTNVTCGWLKSLCLTP